MLSRFANNRAVFQEIFNGCDNFLFDCDGVLWQGNEAIKGAVHVINQLQECGKKVLFVTNNSTKTRKKYQEKLTNLGFTSSLSHIFSTAYTSALYLKQIAKITGKVYLVGNESMGEELQNFGIDYFGVGPDASAIRQTDIASCHLESNVNAVLVGFDAHFSYSKLIKSASYLNNPDCLYVATNEDHRMPMPGVPHVIPGTGCFVGSVSIAAGKPPDVLCGKPGTFLFKCIQETMNLDPEKTIMIGDRMNTDILFGKRNHLKTLLVLTGVESMETMENAATSDDPSLNEQVPDYCMPAIGDWEDLFQFVTPE